MNLQLVIKHKEHVNLLCTTKVFTNILACHCNGKFVNVRHWNKVCDPEVSLFHFVWFGLNLKNREKDMSECIYFSGHTFI